MRQHSLGTTPLKAVYSRDPPPITRYQASPTDSPVVQHLLQQRDTLLNALKTRLARAHNFMTFYVDHKCCDFQFQPSDLVLVKLQPYR